MSPALGPTVGGDTPGPGLRVRLDHPKALPSADFCCACGQLAEDAVGAREVQQLVIRAERHMRDTCTNPAVRAAAAHRDWRRHHPPKKRRK
ncbi:hypothetical protein [Streptomyces sp. Z26]|uniref:hypothetical protein n=1 Tax=Streptomyces sp. Z26 TaxID=2500177 RepID=UPI000EF13B59|nr:hypothetical protein [Streptomyces sp. Z26]RLL66969.1 hypothetical protein D7M15_08920 [Streptomyces sp. Z26]